ncbi:MAG: hypothetical protein LUH55_14475, partial [Bacteroides thetaiotaomicron]|nr:hypothetical protein [Bacteroides thetaiotaomicron]
MNDSNRFERENNRKNTGGKMKIQHWKVIAIAFSYFFGLWLRFDFQFTNIPTEYLYSYVRFIPFYIIASILFFWFMRMYRGIWRFAG